VSMVHLLISSFFQTSYFFRAHLSDFVSWILMHHSNDATLDQQYSLREGFSVSDSGEALRRTSARRRPRFYHQLFSTTRFIWYNPVSKAFTYS
jgi:hypothetical protein